MHFYDLIGMLGWMPAFLSTCCFPDMDRKQYALAELYQYCDVSLLCFNYRYFYISAILEDCVSLHRNVANSWSNAYVL